MQHAFGFAGGAGGVKNEQRIFGVHFLGGAVLTGFFHELVIPDIVFFIPVNLTAGAAHGEHGMHVGAV